MARGSGSSRSPLNDVSGYEHGESMRTARTSQKNPITSIPLHDLSTNDIPPQTGCTIVERLFTRGRRGLEAA